MPHIPQPLSPKRTRIQVSSRCALALLFVAAVLLAFVTPSLHAKEPATPAPLPIEQMRAVAYTQEFAKRFALPDPEPGTEPSGGIQAMEFAVEPGAKHTGGRYYCKLRLYLDSSLPIAYPEEGVMGSDRMFIFPAHFFLWPDPDNKRWLALSLDDRKHFGERQSRYTRNAALASSNYIWHQQGMFADMYYEEYHRGLFPGLAYVKLDMACATAQWGERYPLIQVWLKKEGAKDYRYQTRIVSDDFLKFPVPDTFFKKIHGWIKTATQYNQALIEKAEKNTGQDQER